MLTEKAENQEFRHPESENTPERCEQRSFMNEQRPMLTHEGNHEELQFFRDQWNENSSLLRSFESSSQSNQTSSHALTEHHSTNLLPSRSGHREEAE